MVGLRWTVWGDDVIERELLRFQHRAVDMRPGFLAVLEDIRDSLRKNFETEGEHGGAAWAPLKEETVISKQNDPEAVATAILHRTLALRDSLIDRESSDQILQIGGDSMTFGSQVFYGQYHMTGTGTMPARKPIQFGEVDKVLFMKTLQRYMVEGSVGAAGAL